MYYLGEMGIIQKITRLFLSIFDNDSAFLVNLYILIPNILYIFNV